MTVIEIEQDEHTYYELDDGNADASAQYITPAEINDDRAIAVGRCVAVKQYRCLVGLLAVVSVCCFGLVAVFIHQHVTPETNRKQQSGEWESLHNWVDCSVSCGEGTRARVKQCNTNSQNDCEGQHIELQKYSLGNCTATRTGCCSCCPVDWAKLHGSCYHSPRMYLSFTDAEGKCKELGGHLVHIETSAENTFIEDLVRGIHWYWIGLDDRRTEGIWKWTGTDTIANFTDWYPGQPDEGTGANCAVINNAQWRDRLCIYSITANVAICHHCTKWGPRAAATFPMSSLHRSESD